MLKDIPGDDPLMDLCPWQGLIKHNVNTTVTPYTIDTTPYSGVVVYSPPTMPRQRVETMIRHLSSAPQPSYTSCTYYYYIIAHPLNPHTYCVVGSYRERGRLESHDHVGYPERVVFSLAPYIFHIMYG